MIFVTISKWAGPLVAYICSHSMDWERVLLNLLDYRSTGTEALYLELALIKSLTGSQVPSYTIYTITLHIISLHNRYNPCQIVLKIHQLKSLMHNKLRQQEGLRDATLDVTWSAGLKMQAVQKYCYISFFIVCSLLDSYFSKTRWVMMPKTHLGSRLCTFLGV